MLTINHTLLKSIENPFSRSRYAFVSPLLKQSKQNAWDFLKQYADVIEGREFNEAELRCDLPNGARVQLLGSDNPEALRGMGLDGVVLDEFADMNPRVWSEIIRPTLSDRQGWAIFIGTPKGNNHFRELYDRACGDPTWNAAIYRASETGVIRPEELTSARATMSDEQYAQEYECSWVAALVGSYYAKQLEQSQAAGRIGRCPWEPTVPVSTWWDIGIRDATSIWFTQTIGREIRVIDFYEASGVDITHYAKVLQNRPYLYEEHGFPHDAAAKELGTGRSIQEVAESLGIRPVRILPKLSVEDGINAARVLLARCFFDAKNCEDGLNALRHYRQEWDEKRQCFKDAPLHDWSSHAADAFRYFAIGWQGRQSVQEYPFAETAFNPRSYDHHPEMLAVTDWRLR